MSSAVARIIFFFEKSRKKFFQKKGSKKILGKKVERGHTFSQTLMSSALVWAFQKKNQGQFFFKRS